MKPIDEDDFTPIKKIPKSFFRASNAHLDADEFERKWKSARKSAFRFFRSFAHTWHLDMADLPRDKIPGSTCFCLGDPHPENFGIVTFRDGPHYVFNDLDDAGPGYAALDALRYFTALALMDGVDPKDYLQLYEDLVYDRTHHRSLPLHLVPSLEEADKKELDKWLDGTSFRLDDPDLGLEAVDPLRCAQILAALDDAARLDGMRVLSVAERRVEDGGSAGLQRLMVLVEDERDRLDLLELKEMPLAASSWSRQLIEDDDRLLRAVQEIWRGLTPFHHREVILGRKSYMLRTRLGRAKLRLDKVDDGAKAPIIETQVSILGRQHRTAYRSAAVQADDLDVWLKHSMKTARRRWEALYDRLAD